MGYILYSVLDDCSSVLDGGIESTGDKLVSVLNLDIKSIKIPMVHIVKYSTDLNTDLIRLMIIAK
jgi:hypothetical protein